MSGGDLLGQLRQVVGDAHVLIDRDQRAGYEVDWTGRYRGTALAVVRPGTTAEAAAVVRTCALAGVAVVPQGGNTGLVGASVPRADEGSGGRRDQVVLSLRRLDRLEAVDLAASQVTLGAGVTLEAAQAHARAVGLQVGLDLAARGSATVGGLAATNAGGERVLRYGLARDQIVGVEAVLADGSVVRRLSGLVKDNVGYDLPGLVVGSEGTLAVITAVRLRLFAELASRAAALIGVASVADAIAVLRELRARLDGLEAVELVERDGMALVCAHLGLSTPLPGDHPVYLLVESAGPGEQAVALAEALDACPGVADAVVAEGVAERGRLWRYRDAHTEAIAAAGTPVKLDVAVPLGVLAAFLDEVRSLVASLPGVTLVVFGHLAEGNLHLNLLGVAEDDVEATTGQVLQLVADHDGSISAEHGLGVAKARWLALGRREADVEAMRAVKRALDPNATLNPGVLFEEA